MLETHMRHRMAILVIAAGLGSAPIAAQTSSGLWTYQFQNGIGQYSTGEFGSATRGALGLACRRNGNVSILTEIRGKPTPASRRFTLTASSRAGSRVHGFTAGLDGSLRMRADAPSFARLWADLRARDIVTLRWSDGQTQVFSLAGAKKLLPARPCG